ncbi:hypothetical protein K6119_03410 [Paracrocinitomix mangrovi]|uniref:hypothetical protein n=1 Tax=Paracrocinitomix mangrovi TaxID=2862509 RepID=UPI001C8DB08E|nr:hypothetical protein [Paracrocinitomix mangrovi]UKN02563.1 hypothetical protein K6119_03410 [Paracrocinitomix mangrovi]
MSANQYKIAQLEADLEQLRIQYGELICLNEVGEAKKVKRQIDLINARLKDLGSESVDDQLEQYLQWDMSSSEGLEDFDLDEY